MTTLAWLGAGASSLPQAAAGVSVALLDKGVLLFAADDNAPLVILSAGVHGNETAPIELLARLCDRVLAGELRLGVRLLMIFGNLPAISQNCRYVRYDLNRLFGADDSTALGDEYDRARSLRSLLQTQIGGATCAYHIDLHTSIKPSLIEQFALLPVNCRPDDTLYQLLATANLGAYVYHSEANSTFTWFSANLGAKSVTLELGFAKGFGQNELERFCATDTALSQLVAGQLMPSTDTTPRFFVADTLIKTCDDFLFLLDKDRANFSPITANTPIACQGGHVFSLPYEAYSLFLNETVACGLRAGLFLQRQDSQST